VAGFELPGVQKRVREHFGPIFDTLRAESPTGLPGRIRSKVTEIGPEYQWISKESDLRILGPLLQESRIFGGQVSSTNANN